jgi:LacI family transcriptional regulator
VTGDGPGLTVGDVVDLIRSEDGPTFVQINEAQAPALLKGLRDAGLRIPEDVSVMTTGAPSWAEVSNPPLSVTDVDYYLCGVRAAELILDLAKGGQPKRRVVRGTYIRRESVGPSPRASKARRTPAARATTRPPA